MRGILNSDFGGGALLSPMRRHPEPELCSIHDYLNRLKKIAKMICLKNMIQFSSYRLRKYIHSDSFIPLNDLLIIQL